MGYESLVGGFIVSRMGASEGEGRCHPIVEDVRTRHSTKGVSDIFR